MLIQKKKYLIEFEEEIKKIYESGKIRSPIHLSGNNEDKLIKIFKKKNKPRLGFFYLEKSLSCFA
jgi:hypothetical protein